MQTSLIGQTLTCAETGKTFLGAADGCTTNYARTSEGQTLSDEGVHLREARELLDRSKPFTCYVSTNGASITGWKGNHLGTTTQINCIKLPRWSHFHGKYIFAYRVRDIHGGLWYGRSSPGMSIILRPVKSKSKS